MADFNDRRYDNDQRGFPARREIWESVIARLAWRNGELDALELHPISLRLQTARTERGRPRLAGPELSRKIIDDVARFSAPFSTAVVFEDGIGKVRLADHTAVSGSVGR